MRKISKFITSINIVLVTIYLFLAQNLLIRGLGWLNSYRFSEQKYIYEYGMLISKRLVYLAFGLSIAFPLIVWLKTRNNFRKHLVILSIGFIPGLYFITLYILSLK